MPFDVPGWAIGDALTLAKRLPDDSIDCIVTSPPYWGLRSYLPEDHPDKAKEMGAEPTLAEYVERLVVLFRELRRALKPSGTCWLNLGDSYAGARGGDQGQSGMMASRSASKSGCRVRNRTTVVDGLKPKDLCLVPYRVALALQADGWWLRDNIVWHKPNPMPSSVSDRCTPAHEAVFLLTKSARYHFDAKSIAETATHAGKVVSLGDKSLSRGQSTAANVAASGNALADSVTVKDTRNKRNVWTIPTRPYSGSHYAVMPPALVEPCIKAGCPAGGIVLDPFGGSGTVAEVAESLGRKWLMFDLDDRNAALMAKRTAQRSLLGLL
jgi:DNA modification methylase